jgi:hypothetical protein
MVSELTFIRVVERAGLMARLLLAPFGAHRRRAVFDGPSPPRAVRRASSAG